MKNNNILDQVRAAARNPLALAFSMVPGFIPIAIFKVAHEEIPNEKVLWLKVAMIAMVLGGCLFSAKSVFAWLKVFCGGDKFKAAGATVLIELAMTIPHSVGLTHAALSLLVIINMVAAASNLAAEDAKAVNRRKGAKKAVKTRAKRKTGGGLKAVA